MKQQADDPTKFLGSDVTSLFSNFGSFSKGARYRELVREEAAYHAVCRWPLLAELQGVDETEPDKFP